MSQLHTPLLSSYWLKNAITVTARAVAVINVATGSGANCVLALGNSAAGGPANLAEAITADGNAELNLQGCSVTTNSSADNGGSADAIYFGPNAVINLVETPPNPNPGGRVSAVGGVSICRLRAKLHQCLGLYLQRRRSGHPAHRGGATPDPYSGVTIPSASSCLPTAYHPISQHGGSSRRLVASMRRKHDAKSRDLLRRDQHLGRIRSHIECRRLRPGQHKPKRDRPES